MNYSPETLKEKFELLPEDIKNALTSTDLVTSFQTIGKKYALHIDQIGELQDETGLVMLGLTPPNQFLSHITGRLRVGESVAQTIMKDVDAIIFQPIKESLKKVHSEHGANREHILKEIEEGSHPSISINQMESSALSSSTELAPLNLVSQKLGGSFSSPPTETKKEPLKKSRPFDPYKEPIE